jgi:ribonuclease HI
MAIHTDSQYSIGVLSKGWKAKANAALIEELRDMLRERPHVRFVHVRGHSGIPLNERADRLARDAVETGKTVETLVHDPDKSQRSSGHA